MEKPKRKYTKKTADAELMPIEGRIPPQALELEEVVLGALLLEKDAYGQISELLKPSSFYLKAHEIIFQAIMNLALNQHPVDMLTVTEELRRLGELETVGGPSYIAGLTMKVASTANLEFHAKILSQKAISREIISFASDVLRKAYDDAEDIEDQMQEAEGRLFEISQGNIKQDFSPVGNLVSEAMTDIQNAMNRQEGISGLASGFPAIDALTSGWQKSDLIIIAARPAMGKTAFVLSMAKNIAVDNNVPVAVFNLEMSGVQLAKRLLQNVCEIDGTKIKNGRLSDQESKQLFTKAEEVHNAPLYIDDSPGLSIFELRTKARRLVREHNVQLIIIDYLQLMNASGMGFGNREQEVSMISRSLKVLAKELKIPIIALSQLNRSVETRQGDINSKRPQLSDLRESGAIEQDADIVCFIHRPEYYKIYEDKNGMSLKNVGEFIIAKHRNGPIGDVYLTFIGEYAKFLSLQQVDSSKDNNYTVRESTVVRPIGLDARTLSESTSDSYLDAANEFSKPF